MRHGRADRAIRTKPPPPASSSGGVFLSVVDSLIRQAGHGGQGGHMRLRTCLFPLCCVDLLLCFFVAFVALFLPCSAALPSWSSSSSSLSLHPSVCLQLFVSLVVASAPAPAPPSPLSFPIILSFPYSLVTSDSEQHNDKLPFQSEMPCRRRSHLEIIQATGDR